MARLLTLLALALAPFWASASDLPRVVSVNVCTDQLVLLLADPEQIVSLSQLSDDPRSSVMADEATGFARNNAQAEMIAVQRPDVVVAGIYNDPNLINMLQSIGIKTVQFPVTQSLQDISSEIRKMGAVLDQQAKAERIANRLERDLAQIRLPRDTAPLAAFFLPNGYALGAGTLSHEILVAAVARNLSVELGFEGNGTLSLEQVVLHQPDLLIGAQEYRGYSMAEDMVTHPALAAIPVLNTSVDWVCGTPFILRAIEDVARAIEDLEMSSNE